VRNQKSPQQPVAARYHEVPHQHQISVKFHPSSHFSTQNAKNQCIFRRRKQNNMYF
jgi:hypothetical protein